MRCGGLSLDQLSFSGGYGEAVAVYDVGALWQLPPDAQFLRAYDLDLRAGADLARWDSRDRGTAVTWLWDASVTALLRWSPREAFRSLLAEAGVGLHLLSATELGSIKRFSTALQLGERLALGTTFGSGDRWEIAALFQHVSNADIKLPNSGLSYWGVTLRLPLE